MPKKRNKSDELLTRLEFEHYGTLALSAYGLAVATLIGYSEGSGIMKFILLLTSLFLAILGLLSTIRYRKAYEHLHKKYRKI